MSAVVSDGVEGNLKKTLRSSDRESERYHKRRLTFVTTVICLGPLAVFLLAVQTIFSSRGGAWGVALILAELLVLATALSVSYLKIGRDHERWISSRIRTEMLRREYWLLVTRVGPYSGLVAREERVNERLAVLNNEAGDPIELLPMMTASRKTWRDSLEGDVDIDTDPRTFAERVKTYREQRVEQQRKWFADRSEQHQHKSELLEMFAKLALAAAFLLAALHLGLLLGSSTTAESAAAAAAETPTAAVARLESAVARLEATVARLEATVARLGTTVAPEPPAAARAEASDAHDFEKWILLAALWLPALGSACVAYRAVLGSQRLALSYKYYANALNGFKESLLELVESPIDASRASLRFRRIVLDVEQLLTEELRQWWMNMVPKQPHVH